MNMAEQEIEQTDLVARLRHGIAGKGGLREEAADEIERLRELLRMWKEVAAT